jgi:RTX calcium-binding nonapeptide repeat (4 copies)
MCNPTGGIKILLLLKRSAGSGNFSPPRGGRTVRRVIILLAVITIAVAAVGGAALAKTIRCHGGNCFGTNRADTIFGTNRHDAIFARGGGDFVSGRQRNDNLNGQNGNDSAFGGRANDWVKGGRGNDMVKGDLGNDRLTGGSGHNTIRAGDGMRDLIICGNHSRNFIYFDPRLDRFRNCHFIRRLQVGAKGGSPRTASIIGLGPSQDSGSVGSTSSSVIRASTRTGSTAIVRAGSLRFGANPLDTGPRQKLVAVKVSAGVAHLK